MKRIEITKLFILSMLGVFLASGCISSEARPPLTDSIVTDSSGLVIGNMSATAEVVEESDTLPRDMYVVDGLIALISEPELNLTNASLAPVAARDTLHVTLYHDNGNPVEMTYTLFEDGGAAAGIGNLYFFEEYPIISELAYGDTHFYDVLRRDGSYFSYSRNGQSHFKQIEVPEGAEDNKIAHLVREAADLLQLYPGNKIRFNVPSISLKGDLQLLTMADVPMYEAADTTLPAIIMIPEKAVLGFMGVNMQQTVTAGKKWIWYEVMYNGVRGWINGHPEFVQERTDEVF